MTKRKPAAPTHATVASLKRLLADIVAERDAARREAAVNARVAAVAAKWTPQGRRGDAALPLDERVFGAGVVATIVQGTLPLGVVRAIDEAVVAALRRFRAGEYEAMPGYLGEDDDPAPVPAGGGK